MIIFDKVTKTYNNGRESLRNINIRIPQGEMMFLTGHSGAGKSTFLKLIARLETVSSGGVFLNHKNIGQIPRKALPFYRRQLGYVYQNHLLLQDYTVADNIALPLLIQNTDKNEIKRRVRAALGKVGLSGYHDSYPMNLSEGEQQRVGIARAVVHRPKILLADEPTGNLDPKLSLDILKIFQQFNKVGVTVIIATHDEAIMQNFNIRNIELRDGCLIRDTTKK